MKKLIILLISLISIVGLGTAFSASTVSVQSSQSVCGVDIGEASVNISVEGNEVLFEGVYCANTGGHSVETSDIGVEGSNIDASFSVEGPEGDQIVTQVITPVEFSGSRELEQGVYNATYVVESDGEVIESGSESVEIEEGAESVEIGENAENGFFGSFRAWLSNFFQ